MASATGWLPGSARGAQPIPLVPTNAVWRLFKGTAEPSPANLPAWRTASFADTPWTEARAPFWYGEAARFAGQGTQLGDMLNRYSTIYLRFRFSVANPAAFESLQLNAFCDDGFQAWLNGRPVASLNPPPGTPTFNALATANVPEPVNLTPYPLADPATLLVTGENILAIQVFNNALGSSDLVFGGELVGTPSTLGAPTLTLIDPAPGPVTTLSSITVTFNEAVRGVRAEDFLVNGASATGVQGSGTTYTFSFPRPPFGPVGISWVTSHTVEDFESPPRRFDASAPGAVWRYELLDPEGPSAVGFQPPPDTTVSALSQIAVTFDKAVAGIDAADLTLNGIAATNLTGLGAGPYVFEFPLSAAPAGAATVAWVASHGITSDSLEPHAFRGGSWRYTVNPAVRPAALVITEIMAENLTSFRDEDQDPEDWIELWNPTPNAVNLAGWSLSNDDSDPGQWVFPPTTLPAGGHLVVYASGKDRRPGSTGRFHTGFKLNPNGGYLGLFGPELPRKAVSEFRFPEQGPDHSWGRENNTGAWRYFRTGSPGARNGSSSIVSAVDPVRFSTPRGFFSQPFNLILTCPTPGARILYTTNGSLPSGTNGFVYSQPIRIESNRILRAAAYATNALPSRVGTHTYLLNQSGARLRLPALSLVTDTNHLYGRNGIMEVSPRNTTKRGAAWERPVSAEFIRVEDNGGFQTDCGIRIQGGDYVRGQYNYRSSALPFSKYSFRLYFRGEYGQGRLEYPLFPETTQTSFDTLVLRAGMNDHTNPYLLDEFVRTLARDCGQPAAVGTFVHLFLNGVYRGYYNPCERVDVDFLRAYHGGGTTWDVMAQFGEVREGDATFFNSLRDLAATANLSDPTRYTDLARRLDLTNFVDYLCPLIYVDNDDWPHNNWRAARERAPGKPYRFYAWDAEWSFGIVNGHSPTFNTILNQLSSSSPPWGGTDIQRIFVGLRRAPEFRQLFADRVHRHFFNGGALTDERIRARYAEVTNRLNGVVSGFNNTIATTWIPNRRRNVLSHLDRAGLLASSNAPALSQHGGRVPAGFRLVITNLTGTVYFTTNGTDPRLPFTSGLHADARPYTTPLVLGASTRIDARTLSGTNWSALTQASFQIDQLQVPLRITEIMYRPPDGDEFEFLELTNLGGTPLNISGFSFTGISFRFPEPSPLMPPGARWIIANGNRPADFSARYPDVTVAGWYDGSLANDGERLELLDREGTLVTSVHYHDSEPWPTSPDGAGPSLEFSADLSDSDPNTPESWQPSATPGGSPGKPSAPAPAPALRITEIQPGDTTPPGAGWIELVNTGPQTANLAGWSLSDDGNPRKFILPQGTSLNPSARLRIWCDDATTPAGLHSGFRLSAEGETLSLYDPSSRRVDVATFGPRVPGYSFARNGDAGPWTLADPTPEAPNEPAALAPSTALGINEWLSNPPPGEPDWIEIHNTDPLRPASLAGLHLGTSNALHRLLTPLFIAPSGFLKLTADGDPLPDHLAFKLPAAGDGIMLYDRDGTELQRVTYRNQAQGISLGRIPDGTGAPVPLPGTATPGASNQLGFAAGPKINEFMARNTSRVRDAEGRIADWIELRNPDATSLPLGGYRIALGAAELASWTFPTGTVIPANGFLVLACDPSRPASTRPVAPLNCGLTLPGEGGEIRVHRPTGQATDGLRYGFQLENRSAGNANGVMALLAAPTPGAANSPAATLGNPASARLNEWHASAGGADGQDDWFEVFNPEPIAINLAGFLLTDDPSRAGLTNHVIAPLSFVAPSGFARWKADGDVDQGPDHVPFRLSSWSETIRLLDPTGTILDSIDIILPEPGVSEGRFPDGSANLVRFPGSSSPGQANWVVHPDLVIHEVLAHTDPPLEDALELLNVSARTIDLSGWYLSNEEQSVRKIRLPAMSPIPPGGLRVIYEQVFGNPAETGAFTLNSAHGDEIWLSEADTAGTLTGRRVHARVPATANAESFGLHRTSIGWDFAPMSRLSFGRDLPTSVQEFRQGQGLPNPYPRIGPVVISEIHLWPRSGPDGTENPDLEYVELHNLSSQPVPLFDPGAPPNTWRLRGGVDFEFPPGQTLAPGARVLVVGFAPTNTPVLAAFRAGTGTGPATTIHGPFRGRLNNDGEEVRLERPDAPQAPPRPDAGYVPWLLVDRVDYRPAYPWPDLAASPGNSLQRRRSVEYGNDPAHWILATPTPGNPTVPPTSDRDFDGMANDWETTHQLNPDDPTDAPLDTDGDGQSNLAEFIAGTDPRNARDTLSGSIVIDGSAGAALRFKAVAGRTYSVLQRDDAAHGPWRRFADIPAVAADRDVTVPLSSGSTTTRFFRIVTPVQP